MRPCFVLPLFVLGVVVVECSHVFMGTSVYSQQVYHREVNYYGNRGYEYLNYTVPATYGFGRTIQGILAYDLSKSQTASANVTDGGLGYSYVSLRMKSNRGKDIKYDVYIYA